MSARRFGAGVALCWLILALPEVSHHGLAIDSPSLFYAGDRTLFWLAHPSQTEALRFDYPAPEPAGVHSDFFPFPDKNDPFHYPVFAGLVAAITAALAAPFGFDPVAGHHLGLVLLHGFGLFWFTVLAVRLLGRQAGLLAGLSLLLFPEAVGQAFNNAKDWPCVDFYACALLAAAETFVARRPGSAWLAGAFGGLALSCKLNGAFAMACVGALALYALWRRSREKGALDWSAARELGLIYAVASALFLLLWPYLYVGPGGVVAHVRGYLEWYLLYGQSPRATWTDYPFRSFFFTTPPLLMLAAIAGAGFGLRAGGDRRATAVFFLLWVLFPVLRTTLPHSNFYDGNRHFMEYIPGLCALAGLGLEGLLARAVPPRTGLARFVPTAARAIYLASLAVPVLAYRPFEATYFNFLVGGLGGAQSRGLYDMPPPHDTRVRGTEGDYWYGNIGDGLPRLKALLGPDQGVFFCGPAPQQVQMSWTPEWQARARQRPGPGDLIYASPRETFCGLGLVRALETQRPVLERIERGGGLIYEILGPQDGQPHPQVTAPSVYEATRQNWGFGM